MSYKLQKRFMKAKPSILAHIDKQNAVKRWRKLEEQAHMKVNDPE